MGSIIQNVSEFFSPSEVVAPAMSEYKPQFTKQDEAYSKQVMANRDANTRNIPYQPEFLKGTAPVKERTAKDIVLPMIRDYETFQAKVYDDGYGNPTIGYGMTSLPNGEKVTWNTPDLTQEEAELMLNQKVDAFTKRMEKFPTFKALKPHQQAALLDIAFTTGPNIDEKRDANGKLVYPTLSAVLKDPSRVEELRTLIPQFRIANKQVSQGLVNRRKDTSAMFDTEGYEYKTKAERAKKK
jgi:lysozyme